MYSIEFSGISKQFLEKMPQEDKEITLRKIYSIGENPFRYLKRLKGTNLWRLRVLKYRVIVDVVISRGKIIVLKIGYRKNIYKK